MSFDQQHSFTEVTSQSWLGRLGESIKGVIIGFILFVMAFPLLWWNEARAVHTAGGLKELAHEVVSVKADSVEPTNNDKPVHITAQATSDESLTDTVFNVTTKGIKLARSVAMYQWEEHQQSETRKKLGGGTETVTSYTYAKAWPADPKAPSRSQQPGVKLDGVTSIVPWISRFRATSSTPRGTRTPHRSSPMKKRWRTRSLSVPLPFRPAWCDSSINSRTCR